MIANAQPAQECSLSAKVCVSRFFIAMIFSIAFGYIEAAVVVYLRVIFYPDGFNFPLSLSNVDPLWRSVLLTEIGREAATIVLIVTGAFLFGKNLRQRAAYFLIIFSIWDIFYYIWLKVLLNWPASILDWDILFLIPLAWASPVLAPIIVSVLMLLFAVAILYCDYRGRTFAMTFADWLGLNFGIIIIIVSFCIAGVYTARENYRDYFYWLLFAVGLLPVLVVFFKHLLLFEKKS
jgi:hypothetical protein